MEEQKEVEKINWIQLLPWLVNNVFFCSDKQTHTRNDNEEKQHFLQQKEKQKNNNKAYKDGSKNTGKKVFCAAVFADFIRR